MLEYLALLIIEWLIVFGINVIPAMAPPTWMVLSFLYIAYPQDIFILIMIGATASTCGRYVLAKASGMFAQRLANGERKEQLSLLKERLDSRPRAKFIFALLFALGPLPSNTLFIVAGATGVRLKEILAGFFVGRLMSYLFLTFTTQKVFASVAATAEGTANLFTIMIELIGVISIIVFFKFDWEKLIWNMGGKGKKAPAKSGKKKR